MVDEQTAEVHQDPMAKNNSALVLSVLFNHGSCCLRQCVVVFLLTHPLSYPPQKRVEVAFFAHLPSTKFLR